MDSNQLNKSLINKSILLQMGQKKRAGFFVGFFSGIQ